MKTLIFINQKGGVGKSTSVVSVGSSLARRGYRVLLVDIDPQGDISTIAGITVDESDATINEVLRGKARPVDAIRAAPGGYDILPADIRLTAAELDLAPIKGRDFLLRRALERVSKDYDFALIDSPKSLSIITIMGLTAADGVIVVLKGDYLALNAIVPLMQTIDLVKQNLNPSLEYTGVLLTLCRNTNSTKLIAEQAEQGFPGKVFNTRISLATAIADAPGYGMDIFNYMPKSKPAMQYDALTGEILDRLGMPKENPQEDK